MAKLHGTGSFGKNCMNCICHLIVKVTAPPFLPHRETNYHCGPKTVPSSSSGTKLSIIDSFSLICAGRRWRSKRCFFSRFPFQQTNSGLAARKKQPKLQTQNLSTFYLFLNIRSIDLVFKTKAIWLTYRAQNTIYKKCELGAKIQEIQNWVSGTCHPSTSTLRAFYFHGKWGRHVNAICFLFHKAQSTWHLKYKIWHVLVSSIWFTCPMYIISENTQRSVYLSLPSECGKLAIRLLVW